MKKNILLALKGMAMGMAEVVPGVSGGTIAFVSGIYEELLATIKGLTPDKIGVWKNEGFNAFWKAINGTFLLFLMGGMAAGVVVGVLTIAKLLEHYPILVWSFFFGLIVASVLYVFKQIDKWTPKEVVFLILSFALSYYITIAAPSEGPQTLWFVFISGFIAICALMLPGISGSFILLLLGMYEFIVTQNVKELLVNFNTVSLVIVIVFALGCLAGLLSFSRVLTYTFQHFKMPTLAALTGFLIGSLNKIWPWKEVLRFRYAHDEIIPLQTKSILPTTFQEITGENPYILGALLCMVLGFLLLFLLEKYSNKIAE